MAQMKGMELPLKVIVVVVIVLIAALVVLTIFRGGIDKVGETIMRWLGQVPSDLPGTGGKTCAQLNGAVCDAGKCGPSNSPIPASDIPFGGGKVCCLGVAGVPSRCA